jgi:hypothetical protein
VRSGTRESLEPSCPFCGTSLKRPATVVIDVSETALGGTCGGCDALYLVDPTSKNVGLVMMQALGLAAEKLSKDMTELVVDEDYEDAVLNYDARTHRSSGISRGFMDGHGRLYMLKVKKKQV